MTDQLLWRMTSTVNLKVYEKDGRRMKKGFAIIFIAIATIFLLIGCSGNSKGDLDSGKSEEMFDDPGNYIGYTASLEGQIISQPKLIDNSIYGFRIIVGDDKEHQVVVYSDGIVSVQKYDVVSVKGTIYNTKVVATNSGDLTLPLLYPTEVKVTDTSYRTKSLEKQQDELEALRQDLLVSAQSLQNQNDTGALNMDEYSKLNQDKEKYDKLREDYDEHLAKIEWLNN